MTRRALISALLPIASPRLRRHHVPGCRGCDDCVCPEIIAAELIRELTRNDDMGDPRIRKILDWLEERRKTA